LSALNIVLIDDDAMTRKSIGRALASRGHNVRAYASSLQAVGELLSTLRFDVIISDFDMPGKNGVDVFNAVEDLLGDRIFILNTGNEDIHKFHPDLPDACVVHMKSDGVKSLLALLPPPLPPS
jgi:two-component system, NtrC family, C4-dicarboxylate transport response regulator DctD